MNPYILVESGGDPRVPSALIHLKAGEKKRKERDLEVVN